MKTIAVVHQKGGVGKTTIAINLALYYARNGMDVVMTDTDAQGSLSATADLLTGFQLVPLSQVIAGKVLADVVIIDTPPSNDVSMKQVLAVSNLVVIPLKPGYLEVLALKSVQAILAEMRTPPPAVILLNMVPTTATKLTKKVLSLLDDSPQPVLKTRLHQRTAYGFTTTRNGVFGTTDKKAQTEIENLADELFELL